MGTIKEALLVAGWMFSAPCYAMKNRFRAPLESPGEGDWTTEGISAEVALVVETVVRASIWESTHEGDSLKMEQVGRVHEEKWKGTVVALDRAKKRIAVPS